MARAHEHTVPTFILRAPVEFARAAGVDVDRALRRHGISPETLHAFGARTSAVAAMDAWNEMAAESGDPDFGLRLATQAGIGSYDVFGYIVRSSPDLARGLEQFVRYQRLLGDAWRIDVRVTGTAAILTHEFLVPVGNERHLVEHHLGIVAIRLREFTRDDCHPLEVQVRHAAPSSVATHEHVFRCPVRFAQRTNAIRIDRSHLELPMRLSDSRLAAVLERYATEALQRLPPPSEFAARVRRVLVELLEQGDSSADSISRKLHTSSRTLQRRLTDEGTSLRRVIDEVRSELADEYLGNSWMSLEEIALLLGFADTSGFTHAFRRWHGRSPSEFRREKAHGKDLRVLEERHAR